MRSTRSDLANLDARDELELIDGAIVERVFGPVDHSIALARLAGVLGGFDRRSGGWRLGIAVHVGYASGDVFCHDATGWRRDRAPDRLEAWPVTLRPDWVCEIVSPRHEKRDYLVKPAVLHACEVPYYWVVHPEEKMLLVHRWSPEGYTVILRATSGDHVHAEPFEVLELEVAELFGDE